MRAVKGLTAEVVNQIDQLVARQLVLLVEIDLAGENAVEIVLAVGVGPFDGEHGVIQRLAELGLGGTRHGGPSGRLGHDEVVILRVACQQKGLILGDARLC